MRNSLLPLAVLLALPLAGVAAHAGRTFTNASGQTVLVMLTSAKVQEGELHLDLRGAHWAGGLGPHAGAGGAGGETLVEEFKQPVLAVVPQAPAPVRTSARTTFSLGKEGFWNVGVVLPPGAAMSFSTARTAMAPDTCDELKMKVLPEGVEEPGFATFAPEGLRLTYRVAPDAHGAAMESLGHELTPAQQPQDALPFRVLDADGEEPGLRLADLAAPKAPSCCTVM